MTFESYSHWRLKPLAGCVFEVNLRKITHDQADLDSNFKQPLRKSFDLWKLFASKPIAGRIYEVKTDDSWPSGLGFKLPLRKPLFMYHLSGSKVWSKEMETSNQPAIVVCAVILHTGEWILRMVGLHKIKLHNWGWNKGFLANKDQRATVGMFDLSLFDNSNWTSYVWNPSKVGMLDSDLVQLIRPKNSNKQSRT